MAKNEENNIDRNRDKRRRVRFSQSEKNLAK